MSAEEVVTTGPPVTARTAPAPGRWIEHWNPEDPKFWESPGRRIARRNLVFSILAEHLGFSVWLPWSIVAVRLDDAGFAFSADQLFWLVAVPSLCGGNAADAVHLCRPEVRRTQLSFPYIGTCGSFIGYSAAFPLLIKTQFPDGPVAKVAFLGARVGSLIRPIGGLLSDRLGGSWITAWSFVAMGTGGLHSRPYVRLRRRRPSCRGVVARARRGRRRWSRTSWTAGSRANDSSCSCTAIPHLRPLRCCGRPGPACWRCPCIGGPPRPIRQLLSGSSKLSSRAMWLW
jgi:hypothetical protein